MANLLTSIRLLLIVPVAWAFARPEFLPAMVLLSLIVIAIVTDYFDGIVARKTHSASPSGQLFDHATDFLFVTAGLAGAAMVDQVTLILPILIAIAFSQYVLDSYFLYRDKQLRMSFLGRWNGVFYFVPLVMIAIARLDLMGPLDAWLYQGALLLSYALAVSTVASIIDRAIAPLRAQPLRDSQTC